MMIHTLVSLLVTLLIVGLVLWVIQQIPGIPDIVKTVAYVVTGIILIIYLLEFVGGPYLLR